jgi:glutamate-1-semialdehyde 2,1-aminomutase
MGHLVGGISSAGRALPLLNGLPLIVDSSMGPYVWDTLGQRYIDTALGFGATVVGHANTAVLDAVSAALARGPLPAFAHELEEIAAAALAACTGDLSRVVFVNTGSEAVHLACRLARVHTGRRMIAKFAAAYDGWYDDVAFGNAGSAEATMVTDERPTSGNLTLLRYNDFEDAERLFASNMDIAAVLVEPVLANSGCIVPRDGYLEHLRDVARRHGALLIADEVLMGFRTRRGLFSHATGLDPDLTTVGKAIGSGIPVAAVLGRPEIMRACETGKVNRAGTYSGNPVAAAAVAATMNLLSELDYEDLLARGDRLRGNIERAFRDAGLPAATSGYGSVFTIWFAENAPQSYAEAVTSQNPELSLRLHREVRSRGVIVMPSSFGRLYLSSAHDEPVIAALTDAFRSAARAMI